MRRPNPSEIESLIACRIKINCYIPAFPGKDYRKAPMWVKRKKHTLYGAVVQPAVAVTRTLLSMNDFIGTCVASLFWPNREISRNGRFCYRHMKLSWNRDRLSPISMPVVLFFCIKYEIKMQRSINCIPDPECIFDKRIRQFWLTGEYTLRAWTESLQVGKKFWIGE